MSTKTVQDAQSALEKSMLEHPTGLFVAQTEKSVSAVFWNHEKMSDPIFFTNLITGVIHQGVGRRFFTKAEIIKHIEEVIEDLGDESNDSKKTKH